MGLNPRRDSGTNAKFQFIKLKIISFNLRYDKPDRGNNAWTVRRDAVTAIVKQAGPDIIGTQEGQGHQLLDLHRLLPEYQSIGGDRLGKGVVKSS